MSITVKVTGEVYRVYPTGKKIIYATMVNDKYIHSHAAEHIDHPKMTDAVKHAFRIAGEIGCDVMVDRVTQHEPVTNEMAPDDWFGELVGRRETITGELYIPLPHFTDPSLSRYHPNNGWVVPETIEIK